MKVNQRAESNRRGRGTWVTRGGIIQTEGFESATTERSEQ